MNRSLLLLLSVLLMISCKSKRKSSDEPAANFFVSDYIKGQVAILDTLRKPFFKIETTGNRSDTSSVTNAQAKAYAKDFLELPDISSEKLKDDYEVSHLFDDLQEAFIFTYTTKEDHAVQREDVTVEPQLNAKGTNDIRSMYADFRKIEGKDNIRKNMLWEANKSFLITTITNAAGTPENITSIKVIWNGFTGKTK